MLSDLSVVKGGILRFKAFEAIPPLVFSLGMMASEPYDPKVHPFMLRDLNEEDPSLVLRSPNNGKHWLRACWRELVVGVRSLPRLRRRYCIDTLRRVL